MQHVDEELERLKKETIEMWTLVYNQLQRASESVQTLDRKLAAEVVFTERRVNAFELRIDNDVEDMIALYNPVAVNLRFTLAILEINMNLERIGDFAKGIAHFVMDFKGPAFDPGLLEKLRLYEMTETVEKMLRILKESLENESPDSAKEIFDLDYKVDEINHDATPLLRDYILENPESNALTALQLVGIFRKLERVGDHCTNIAEEIIFYLEAKVLKHKGIETKK